MFSCETMEISHQEDSAIETCIYRERDPNYPLILSLPRERTLPKTRVIELGFDDLLGRSFKLDYFPFENMQNIGEPVINLKKLEKDHPEWATKIFLRQSTSNAFSYSSFESYEEKSSVTKKVNGGFSLNLGLFKIGNKTTYYNHFTSSLLQNRNSVFGQLDIEIEDARYKLAVNSNRLDLIKKDYIEADFFDDLYNLHPYEFFSFYGPFIITNFVTGGRASAFFAGITKTISTAESQEKKLDSEISSSFSISKDGNSSISLGFGKGFTNGTSSTETFTQLEATLVTLGGAYGLGAFTTPKSIDNMNIDLTAWANSLNNATYHTLVDIHDDGLVPLSAFFIEKNLKSQYENFLAAKTLPSKEYIEPKLVCRVIPLHSAGRIGYKLYLITRFNDAIFISGEIFLLNDQGKNEMNSRLKEFYDLFKIKVEQAPLVPDETFMQGFNFNVNMVHIFSGGSSIEVHLKKYYDKDSKMLYLLYNENGRKEGYSIYMGKGDYLLDTYGMRHWVDNLPSISIEGDELMNYMLIAL